MSQGDETERRQYERIPANGMHVGLQFSGRPAVQATLIDVSRGGACILHRCADAPGSSLDIAFGGNAVFGGRIARNSNGTLGVSFRQDPASLELIDRLLALVGEPSGRQAA
jgi:hypothetical protein